MIKLFRKCTPTVEGVQNTHRACGGAVVALAILLGVTGCGGNVSVSGVSGNVTLDGEPVTSGEVIFISDEGFGSSGALKADGSYVLLSHLGQGIPPGEYKVAITPPEEPEMDDGTSPQPAGGASSIPVKYHDFGGSGLTAVVADGDNQIDFDLEQ